MRRGRLAPRLSFALRQRLVGWLFRGVRLPALRVGANTIDFNPSAAPDCLRWSGTSTPTAKGDLGMNVDTGLPRIHDGASPRVLVPTDDAIAGSVTTSDGGTINAAIFTPPDGRAVLVLVHVVARRDTGAEGAGYLLAATYRRSGATTTQIGATTVVASHEDVGAWDATLDAAGADIRVRVTGAVGSTIGWNVLGSVSLVA